MLESEADRLASIKALGGEPFSTGFAEKLIGIFDRPSVDSFGQVIAVKNRKPELAVRESDVAKHSLVKQSVLTRDSDGSTWTVRDLDPDGTGMTVISLGA
jgi:hypothetical protein